MDERRIQVYVELIEALLTDSDGQTTKILQQHSELVDDGFLLVMALFAVDFHEKGQTEKATFLARLRGKLLESLGLKGSTQERDETSRMESRLFNQESHKFIWKLLHYVDREKQNPHTVYPFFEKSVAQLNWDFWWELPYVVTRWLEGKNSERQQSIAWTVFHFGNLIQQFPLGNRLLNLELAIIAYEQALQVWTLSKFPQQWAMAQSNLALAYKKRQKGDRAANLERAIHLYQQALQVYTQAEFPEQWAMVQFNLGNLYLNNCFVGDRQVHQEQAIYYYKRALKVQKRLTFPEDWANTQHNLALAYKRRLSGDPKENLERAIHYLEQALQVLAVDSLPANCLLTSHNLGNLHFTAGNWHDAATAYETALAASDKLRSWAAHEDRRQAVQNEVAEVYANLVQCYVNLNRYSKALETVERSRSKRLVELMATNDLYADGNIPPEVQTLLVQIDHCQSQIDALRGLALASPPNPLSQKQERGNPNSQNQLLAPLLPLNKLRSFLCHPPLIGGE